jgi:hypothetical protein
MGRCRPLLWGWPLIHGSPGRLIDKVKRKAANWECRDFSYTEVVSPSAMEFCCTSRWSVLWWTTRSLHGDPFAHFSGNCRYFSPKCLRIAISARWYISTSKITVIWEFLSLPTTSDLWGIRLKMWETPIYAARQMSTLTKGWPRSPKAGRSGWTSCPGYL